MELQRCSWSVTYLREGGREGWRGKEGEREGGGREGRDRQGAQVTAAASLPPLSSRSGDTDDRAPPLSGWRGDRGRLHTP